MTSSSGEPSRLRGQSFEEREGFEGCNRPFRCQEFGINTFYEKTRETLKSGVEMQQGSRRDNQRLFFLDEGSGHTQLYYVQEEYGMSV